jgi:hypothetical protein
MSTADFTSVEECRTPIESSLVSQSDIPSSGSGGEDDPLAPARGIMAGLGLSALLWGAIGLIWYLAR